MPKKDREKSEKKRNRNVNDNGGNDDQTEHDETSSSENCAEKSTDIAVMDIDDGHQAYGVDESETQLSEAIVIGEIQQGMGTAESLDEIEICEKNALCEFPNESNEGNTELPQASFDNISSEKYAKVINITNMESSGTKDMYGNDQQVNLNKTLQKVERDKVVNGSEKITEAEKNPGIPIYEFMNGPSDKTMFNNSVEDLRFIDYGSEEFADVEDNLKDSSSDNSDLALTNLKGKEDIEGRSSADLNTKQKQKKGSVPDTDVPQNLSKRCAVENSSSQESKKARNVVSERKNCKADSGKTSSDESEISPESKSSEKGKQKMKQNLPTIPENMELSYAEEDATFENKPSSSTKTNTLKMKTKVGSKKHKCALCGARLGLCAIRCRCGNYYCAKHRYDQEHNCTFDYRSMGAEEIRKNNPRVVGEKVRKL